MLLVDKTNNAPSSQVHKAVFGPKTLQVPGPSRDALATLKRFTSSRTRWQTCRLIYGPATLFQGREHQKSVNGNQDSVSVR